MDSIESIKSLSEELSEKLARSRGPLRPQSARSNLQSARPQSHRFLQDHAATPRPSSAQQASFTHQRGWILSDLEAWREAFQEEARDCISCLKEALEGSDVKRLANRFFEERQMDAAQISDLRDHITNLLQLNCTLRQNTLDMLSKDELKQLRACIEASTISFSQLLDKHQMQEHVRLDDVAKQAVLQASEVSSRALRDFQNLWKEQSDDMKLERRVDDERWSCMNRHVEVVSQKLEQLDAEWQSKHDSLAARFEERLESIVSGISDKVSLDIHTLSTNEFKGLKELEDNISSAFKNLERKVVEELSNTSNMCKQLRTDVCDKLQDFAITEHSQVDSQKEVHMEEELKLLHEQLTEMRSELVKSQCALDAKTKEVAPSPTQLLEVVRDIERRGHLKINLGTGDVEVLKGMDFVPRKSSEKPTADFSDHILGEAALGDVVQLQKLFCVPLVVEGHTKGGETGFWQSLATNRSTYIMDKLERQGVSRELMSGKGFPGRKGRNKCCVIIRLDIFPDYD